MYPIDILTSDNKYPEREQSDECTTSVRICASDLAERVTRLCTEIGLRPAISSGFRTSQANQLTGGRSRSAHVSGEAVDFSDPKGQMKDAILRDLSILDRCDLYCESFDATPRWVHLQSRPTKSGKRVFIP